jgi:hypothetical protein
MFDAAVAELDTELLTRLKDHGLMSRTELFETFDRLTELAAQRLIGDDVRKHWRSERERLRDYLDGWLERSRRRGYVVAGRDGTNAIGTSLPETEWRLTSVGKDYLDGLLEGRRLVPRSLGHELTEAAADGLRTALKTAIAAFPLLVLARLAGLIRHPSAIGFAIAGAAFGAAILSVLLRRRAVRRARMPAVQAIEEVGLAWAEQLGASSEAKSADLERVIKASQVHRAALEQHNAALGLYSAESDRILAIYVAERAEWDAADPATRGEPPVLRLPDLPAIPDMPPLPKLPE